MEESTLTKVHLRNLICRLCCDAFETHHLISVYGRASKKAGSEEDLAFFASKIQNVQNVRGIEITKSDSL